MAKIVITLEDSGEDVKVNIEFGESGVDTTSGAHYYGLVAFKAVKEAMLDEDELEDQV